MFTFIENMICINYEDICFLFSDLWNIVCMKKWLINILRYSPGSDGQSDLGSKVVRLARKFERGTPLRKMTLRTAATCNGFSFFKCLFVTPLGPEAEFYDFFISMATSDTWTG